ncbi:hypothetical protein L914_09892 [Phytophthora nicotianae]|uniref:Uncharacterized protein n=1 Tax=Phytophthora nicotianae TaxID=4792 RepID=W2N8B4_PHYNI|nr:hypothetical protein L914_09892 [Phytophthora nicotianae]
MAQVFEVNKDVTSEHFRAAATASSWRNGESAGRPLHFNISKRGCFSSRPSVDDGSELNDVHVESCTGRQTAFVGHKRSPARHYTQWLRPSADTLAQALMASISRPL